MTVIVNDNNYCIQNCVAYLRDFFSRIIDVNKSQSIAQSECNFAIEISSLVTFAAHAAPYIRSLLLSESLSSTSVNCTDKTAPLYTIPLTILFYPILSPIPPTGPFYDTIEFIRGKCTQLLFSTVFCSDSWTASYPRIEITVFESSKENVNTGTVLFIPSFVPALFIVPSHNDGSSLNCATFDLVLSPSQSNAILHLPPIDLFDLALRDIAAPSHNELVTLNSYNLFCSYLSP